jgi:hypothetical protein
MSTTTRRLLAGTALAGVAVLSVGAPALAMNHVAAAKHVSHPTHASSTAPVVEIGTATEWVRNADGSVTQVLPR